MRTETQTLQKISYGRLLSGSMMIAGTTIGAGMLGIPLVTSEAGFLPATLATFLVWLFMLSTGLLFLEAALNMPPGANILSMSQYFLGKRGKWIAGGMFVFLYYCLLVAYIAGGAPLIGQFLSGLLGFSLSPWLSICVFTAFFGLVVALGAKWIDRTNLILTLAMAISYVALVGTGSSAVEAVRLKAAHWPALFLSVPVLFSAFGYHNVIPSLCTYLKKDSFSLKLSLFIGTGFAFVVYLLWQWLIIGSIPQSDLLQALSQGMPATQALQAVTGKIWIYTIGQYFAFFALVTSMLGVAFSMVDFLGEGFKYSREGRPRMFLAALTFLPPFACALYDPQIFDRALGIAGGFGEAFLNGFLPVVLVWMGRRRLQFEQRVFPGSRISLLILLGTSLFVMVLEGMILLT